MKYWCPKCYHIKDFVNDIPQLGEERECPFCQTEMQELKNNPEKAAEVKSPKKQNPMWHSVTEFENGVHFFINEIKKYGVTETWKLEVEKTRSPSLRIKMRWEFMEALKRMGKTFELME